MVQKYSLKNGIPVFIVETHASPVVSIQAWVSRGSVYESEKLAGISHFLEHALFKGTQKREVGQIALEIESHGGEVNAFTSFEETAYYTTLASRYFEEGLDVIADALQNPLFDADEMAREREVILEEIKRAQDSPSKLVSMNLWKTAFSGTPFGRPVLGFTETVRKIDHRTLRDYFSKNYHAGTTSLFIVGDIETKKALAIAQKKFGKMRRGISRNIPKKLNLPRHKTIQIAAVGRDIKDCQLQIAVHAPEITHACVPAYDLMCSALAQGEGSRLYQRLVKQTHLAIEAHLGLMATGRCGLATTSLVVPTENLEAALKEARGVLQTALDEGLQEEEIERIKSSLEAEIVEGKETVDGYARRLGYYYIQFGDPNYEKKYLDNVLAVTRERATQAISELFSQTPVLSMAHPSNFALDKKAIAHAIPPLRLKKKVAVKVAAQLPEKTLKSSLVYITKKVDALPIISLRILFLGGAREEKPSQYGLTHLFQRMWTAGTPSFSALQMAQTLDSLGASLYGFSGKNTFGISAEFLSKHWPIVKPMISEVLHEPTFPEKELQTEKNLIQREILSERDSASHICNLNFLKALYGDHPYGRSSLGNQQTVSSFTTDHLNGFFRESVHRKRAVVSAVGSFQPDRWINELDQILCRIPEDGRTLSKSDEIEETHEVKIITEKKEPLFQSHILVGFLGASFKNKERYALKLLASALAGQGGRLFLELRDKLSLAYTVAPISNDGPDRGIFGVYIGCGTEKWKKSIQGIRTEIDKVIQTPMGSKELARAKEYWIGRFELDMQRYSAQAMLFGLDEIYGLGYKHSLEISSFIKSISTDDILSAAQKFLKPSQAVISIVHNDVLHEEEVRAAWGESESVRAIPKRKIAIA